MISMTGFGHAERALAKADIVVDVRGVNSRYLDLKIHLARDLIELEPLLKAEVQRVISRGRIDLFVDVRIRSADLLGLDAQLLKGYLALAERLNQAGVQGELTVAEILAIPGVVSQASMAAESIQGPVIETVNEALKRLVEGRKAEGAALEAEIGNRLDCVATLVEQISEGAGRIRDHYRAKFEGQLQLWGKELQFDEKRLAEEVFFFVQRSDITEELARLRSHIERFRGFLKNPAEASLGKNLDFLCQELHREVNTILSKSPLADVSQKAVDAKTEIDRIREQVQNVE